MRAMKRDSKYLAVTIIVIAIASTLWTGCGKNVMGPTAPTALVAQQVGAAETMALPGAEQGTVEAACKGRDRKWNDQLFHHHLGLFNHGQIRKWIMFIVRDWFQDEDLTNTMENILSSKLFYIITFKCGVGTLLFWESLKILAETWYPGLDTNPAQCTAEITLLPYQWDPHSGFYGEFLSEWGNGRGYHLTSYTPLNDKIELFTSSSINNIYKNVKPIISLQWNYAFIPNEVNNPTGKPKILFYSVANMYYMERLTLFWAQPQFLQKGDEKIIGQEVWASTQDKSARCLITSRDSDMLNMDLQFDATGAGGGTVVVRNWHGQVDNYFFDVKASGHGYYTKNGGKKQPF
jgi:hypothetical protein